MSGELCAQSPSESTYLAKLKLLSFQGLICETPMEGLGGGSMKHKMMINEFIGHCTSNKSSEHPRPCSSLNTTGVQPLGSATTKVSPTSRPWELTCLNRDCFWLVVPVHRFKRKFQQGFKCLHHCPLWADCSDPGRLQFLWITGGLWDSNVIWEPEAVWKCEQGL